MITQLTDLATLIREERANLLARWREQVRVLPSARQLDTPTLNDHIPLLIDELAQALAALPDTVVQAPLLEVGTPDHGAQRVEDGFDIEEVVAEYNILRDVIHELADAHGLGIQGQSARILNRVLDGAVGMAVKSFAARSACEARERREEYLSFLAHDLRTPLNAIYLATRVLDASLGQDADKAAPLLKVLRRNVQQLDTLVNQVIAENTSLLPEAGLALQRRTFDLWPLAEGLLQDLQPVAQGAATRLVNAVPLDLAVYADAGLLRRVFQNLVTNSITYSPGGEVALGARTAGDDGGVECWVRDNGAGIPPERLDKIFDKLESDPANEDGLGLGLAIVKSFVEAHSGSVSVESMPGHGSTFWLRLPSRDAAGMVPAADLA